MPRLTLPACVSTDTNSTSRDPVEKKDETPFGVSVGSKSRTWDKEAGQEVHLMSFQGKTGRSLQYGLSSCQLTSQPGIGFQGGTGGRSEGLAPGFPEG